MNAFDKVITEQVPDQHLFSVKVLKTSFTFSFLRKEALFIWTVVNYTHLSRPPAENQSSPTPQTRHRQQCYIGHGMV